MPATNLMNNATMWVHAKESILLNGLTQHKDVEDDGTNPDFDPEQAKKDLEQKDPYQPRLKPLSNDDHVTISENHKIPAWQIKLCGDKTDFAHFKDPKKSISNAVVTV